MEPHPKFVDDPAEPKAVDGGELESPDREDVVRESEGEKSNHRDQADPKDKVVDMGAEEIFKWVGRKEPKLVQIHC